MAYMENDRNKSAVILRKLLTGEIIVYKQTHVIDKRSP